MSWKSPIEVVYNDLETNFEDGVFKAIQRVQINVDKDELMKALQYDRDQYEKGYEDGKRDAEPQWMPCSEGLPKTDDVYLVTIHPDYIPQECKQVDRMYYFEGEWRWLNEKAEWEKWPYPIIAWMPLPTPYEAEKEEE